MTIRGTVRGMAGRANPAFAAGAVAVPLAALALAVTAGSVEHLTYVHVMAGVLWTGIDLFMAMVVGPVLGGLAVEERASWFERFTPKMTFLMPTLATVTIFGGILLAVDIGKFPRAGPWIALFVTVSVLLAALVLGWVFRAWRDWRWQVFAAGTTLGNGAYLWVEVSQAGTTLPETSTLILVILAVMVVLVVQGFGLLMPTEVLVYRETISAEPDRERISELGLRNARLSGVQGLFQLVIVVLMVYLRWGVTPW